MADTAVLTAAEAPPATFTALDRLKAAVAAVPRGFRGRPPVDKDGNICGPAPQRHVAVLADDVAEVAGQVKARGTPSQQVQDLHKGCTHVVSVGRQVYCQADDVYHLIDQAGG